MNKGLIVNSIIKHVRENLNDMFMDKEDNGYVLQEGYIDPELLLVMIDDLEEPKDHNDYQNTKEDLTFINVIQQIVYNRLVDKEGEREDTFHSDLANTITWKLELFR